MGPARALLSAALAALLLSGCRESREGLALGYLVNVTHGQALVGVEEGRFAEALGATPFTARQFGSGPAAMEALLAGELDMAYVGAAPAIVAHVRSGGRVRVLSGAVSGGAVLVARSARRPEELSGKKVAAPQIGNTQDVALRHWLLERGVRAEVFPLASSEILGLFARGHLEAAWVPEPWGARLVHEAGGRILVDERELWPEGRFPATVLVVTEEALEERPAEVAAVLRAHEALTERWRREPVEFAREVNTAFSELTGKKLSEEVLRDAFSRMEPTADPMASALEEMERRLVELKYLPRSDLSRLVARR
ncbi:MAG: ABC transporter substrate-binding protein [Myxococcales bacterium]|nr:ABC transporter substrate-binding protein [Myxococcales bacterium]